MRQRSRLVIKYICLRGTFIAYPAFKCSVKFAAFKNFDILLSCMA